MKHLPYQSMDVQKKMVVGNIEVGRSNSSCECLCTVQDITSVFLISLKLLIRKIDLSYHIWHQGKTNKVKILAVSMWHQKIWVKLVVIAAMNQNRLIPYTAPWKIIGLAVQSMVAFYPSVAFHKEHSQEVSHVCRIHQATTTSNLTILSKSFTKHNIGGV